MAKRQDTTSAAMRTAEGFEQVATDIVGFYSYKEEGASGEIFFVPLDIILMDGNIKKEVPTAIITCRLLKPAKVVTGKQEDDSKQVVAAKTGDMIGIWYKPGMKALINLCGAEVQMYQEGSKDTGMPSEMLLFKIAKKPGSVEKRLPVSEDRRDRSRGQALFGVTEEGKPNTQPDYNGEPLDDERAF